MTMKQLSMRSFPRVITAVSIIVVSVILIYIYDASQAFSSGKKYKNIAAQQHTENIVESFGTALLSYTKDCGFPPSKEFGLSALMTNSAKLSGWSGPYLKWKEDADAWGTPYRYELIDGDPVVSSAGADKNFETKDDVVSTTTGSLVPQGTN